MTAMPDIPPPRRRFADVLVALIREVPTSEFGLRGALERILRDCHFRAPEAQWPFSGSDVQLVLEQAFAGLPADELREGWRARVLRIWTGRG